MSTPEYDELIEVELTGENKEVYLFQWLTTTLKYVQESPIPDLKAKQGDIEKQLIKIISSPEPYPTPGRAFRNLSGKCLVQIYTRAETRTMFDVLQALMKIAGDFKAPADRDGMLLCRVWVISWPCSVMSFMAEIATVTLRTAKSSYSTLLRYQALVTLKKSSSTGKRAITDAITRDIFKQCRNYLTDKALPVQRAAADVIIAMYCYDDGSHPTTSDIEAILNQCIKSLDTADQLTRHTLAKLVGHLLASTQVERAVPVPEPSQKPKKDQENADDDIISPSQAAEVKKAQLTLTEMLLLLSNHFNKPHQSRKIRIGVFDFYAALFTQLGSGWVEANFSLIVAHLMNEIVSLPRNSATRYETLSVRTLVGILLRDLIGIRMLSEQGQIIAIQELANNYLKRWPAMMPGQTAPSSPVLVMVLREVAGLLQQLGNAPPPVQDALSEPLITILSHPSHTSLGHAYGLAALVSVIPERPLYVSYDVSAKVLDMATQLLKRASDHDLKVAGIEVEVAWTLIASLMSLGPNFVRPHLPQLLVLWRNALPKPTSKDSQNNTTRSIAEWNFLLHVRESALGAILCFLQRNATTLVTLDVARRIASLLSNALSFANGFISQSIDDPSEQQQSQQLPPGIKRTHQLTLRERESLLRRRVYQCFTELGFGSIPESTQASLLQSTISVFAGPEVYGASASSAVQAAIASSAGTFVNVWSMVDGFGYGVTSNEVVDFGGTGVGVEGGGVDGIGGGGNEGGPGRRDYLNRDNVEVSIDTLLRKPILGACEHDPLSLCQSKHTSNEYRLIESPPPVTSVIDTAIELFSRLLPLQDLSTTIKFVQQVLEYAKSPKLEKNNGRKSAVFVNATVALVLALRYATGSAQTRQAKETFGSTQVTALLSPFLRDALIDGDLVLRSAGSECIGRLASLSGTNFLASQIKDLVDQVVSNRDPYSRAGCALAFGAIYTHVGGLAAGPLLGTTVQVLKSLSADPHPVAHFWALNALARVIDAASLSYAPFVPGTLGMLLKIYLMDSHEREGGSSIGNANLGGECPAYPVVCQIIDAVINVLGPDIRESSRTRELVLGLVREFMEEDEEDEGICVEAIKCIQHFLMFAPEHINIPQTVKLFRQHLSSPRRPLKMASINALYQLVQKDALEMSTIGGDALVEELFGMLDDDYTSVQGVRNVIESWLKQTVVYNPSAWIDLCQRIMSRTTASQQVVDAANRGGLRDDEGESLNVNASDASSGAGASGATGRVSGTSRWRTQLFALKCLHEICTIVAGSGRKEHLDAIVARVQGVPVKGLLFTRISDLIKMAFTASTAYVTEIRLEGLVVLRDIIEIFALSPDPAYDDSLLLEQHQAPITAALTPAFSSDSTPEILASAVHACAVFVGCGVVKDVNRMGRILRLLTTALEQSRDSGMLSIGDTGELSPNASAMLRISTLSAWAQLQVSSLKQSYLVNVIQPYRSTLSSLWIASLRDYASIRIDSEVLHDASSVAIDSSYSSLGREVLLPVSLIYYTQSWSIILRAVATVMRAGDHAVLAAMDGQEPSQVSPPNGQSKPKSREDPTAFFYILFGLVYEALSTSTPDTSLANSDRQTLVIACLEALKSLVRPEYAGKAIMEPTIFDEFVSLSYRMAMTEPTTVQVHLVEMLGVLAATQGSRHADALSLTTPRAHCLRICSHVLKHSTGPSRSPITQGQPVDRIALINTSFATLATIATSIETGQREDVRSVAALLYNDLLKDELSNMDLVSPTFASLKAILSIPVLQQKDSQERYQQTIHALLSSCLLNIDEMRGREGAVSTRKIKANMLAVVLILTVIPPTIQVGRAAIEHTCFLIAQKLLENDDTSLTAAQCAKTLVVASSTGNALLRQCTRLLMPGLVEFVAKVAPAVHDDSVTESQTIAVTEVWKAFSTFFASVPEDKRPQLLAVLLPTLSLLLSRSTGTIPSLSSQTVTQILTYATASPVAFKAAADKLEPATRELLEASVRKAVGPTTTSSQTAVKPQISLRSF
ncbi:hypothetical protein NP233_g1065 [Leucocoprinus birnbaumii]|uniref:LAA1-like C-terminal TPR repeats domain-containing protein n=1 Tax=Leucocoprinus birnbaumii TaxID=56174 RepID=A0AAD5W2Z6_9AGAR|nr:hypothetical protein NP233_g1065 [Leucocoprinus birnbaumii]